MKTTFGIKNFRVFDENGVDIELAPITLLTGKNSAGKSSIVRAIAILNSFLSQIRRDKENNKVIHLSSYKLQFDDLFEGTLGSFKDVLHRGSVDHYITFEYVVHSTMLFEDVKVSFTFKDADEGKDEKYMHYGVLSQFCVKDLKDNVIYSSKEGEFTYNLNLIKDRFFDFALGEFLAHSFLGGFSIDGETKEQTLDRESMSKEELGKFDEYIRKNIFRYLRDPKSDNEPIVKNGSDFGIILDSSNDGKQVFQIPVISECLAGLREEDVYAKVEDILCEDKSLDDIEKYVIKHFISDILVSGNNVVEFWAQQENRFLRSVGSEMNQSEEQKNLNAFLKHGGKNVSLPNVYALEVGDGFWESYPGLWHTKNEDEGKKNKAIEKWKETSLISFHQMYETLMRLNVAYENYLRNNQQGDNANKWYYYEEGIEHPAGRYTHKVYKLLCEYASRAIENILYPVWAEKFHYIPSSRALPKRLYTLETGKDFYITLRNYLIAKTEYEDYLNSFRGDNIKRYKADYFLTHWIGKDGFDICKSLSVESVMGGAAIALKLIKYDGTETYLTDEGFGLTQLISMLINIETAILNARGVKYNNYLYQSELDGLDTLKFYYEQQTIAVEEPEIHLHPDYQAKLAEMFMSASEYNIHFMVETHSEYLIRKSQVIVSNNNYSNEIELKKNNPFKVFYVDGNRNDEVLYELGYEITGGFKRKFGPGFYNIAADFDMEIIRKEKSVKKFNF